MLPQARLHNAALPINRLPLEICLEIILLLRSDFGCGPTFSTVIDETFPPNPAFQVPESGCWLSVAQACKRWWDLACGTSQLWRSVVVRKNLDWLHLCLSRSGEAPLELCLECCDIDEVLPIITLVKDRITRLFISHMIRTQIPSVTSFFGQGLPNLRETILTGDLACAGVADPISLDLSKVPQLRHLAVCEFPLLSIADVIPLLVSLDIQWMETNYERLDLESFLPLLQAAKSLQYLRLHYALGVEISWTCKPSGTLISLPSLRTLDLYDYPSCVAGFLEFFNLPVNVALGVHNIESNASDEHFPEDTTPSFLYLLPEDFRDIEILSLATYARMADDNDSGTIELMAKVEPYTRDYLVVAMFVQRDSDASTFVPLFDDFLQLFRYAPLDTIELHGDISRVPKEKWTSLFVQFPNLQTLTISCAGSSPTSVFSALSEVSADDDRKAVCPYLCCIEICEGPKATESEVTSIESCLQRRQELGADSLEELCVAFKKPYELRRKNIVSRLRDLVSDLILDSYI